MELVTLLAREGSVIAPPPPGVIPNYEHPESNGGMYMAGTLITLSFAFIFVGLRITTKISMTGRKLGWDDGETTFKHSISNALLITIQLSLFLH